MTCQKQRTSLKKLKHLLTNKWTLCDYDILTAGEKCCSERYIIFFYESHSSLCHIIRWCNEITDSMWLSDYCHSRDSSVLQLQIQVSQVGVSLTQVMCTYRFVTDGAEGLQVVQRTLSSSTVHGPDVVHLPEGSFHRSADHLIQLKKRSRRSKKIKNTTRFKRKETKLYIYIYILKSPGCYKYFLISFISL